jgi:hypothetical protein
MNENVSVTTGEVLESWEAGGKTYELKRLMSHMIVECDGMPTFEFSRGRLNYYGVPFSKPWRREDIEPLAPAIGFACQKKGRIISAAKGLWQALAVLDAEESAELDDPDLRMTLLTVEGLAAHFIGVRDERERAAAIWHGDCSLAAVLHDLTEQEELVLVRKHCRGLEHFPEMSERHREAAIDFDPVNVGRLQSPTEKERAVAKKMAGSFKPSGGIVLNTPDTRTDQWLRHRFSNGMPAYTVSAERHMKRVLSWHRENYKPNL